jgi:hypothetical protein
MVWTKYRQSGLQILLKFSFAFGKLYTLWLIVSLIWASKKNEHFNRE